MGNRREHLYVSLHDREAAHRRPPRRTVQAFRRVDRDVGVTPLFVFDGDSPEEKTRELKARREQKKKTTTHLRDLQQGVAVLQHLDWRWWQLTVVLRAVALINSPRLPQLVPIHVASSLKRNEVVAESSSASQDARVEREPNVPLAALFQLIAATLEWGTEAFLPGTMVQNLFDKSFLVHELPLEQLPPLIRFVAQIRLRRHTPHMLELDWMNDPSESATSLPPCTDAVECFSVPTNVPRSAKSFSELPTEATDDACCSWKSENDKATLECGVHVPLPPVLIGGGGADDDDNDTVSEPFFGPHSGSERATCNAATLMSCRNLALETLEALIQESLKQKADAGGDFFAPFLVGIHCTRAVADRLSSVVSRYRVRCDAAWQRPMAHSFMVLLIAHDAPDRCGEWLLPSPAVAAECIAKWQETVPWPNKMQEKVAKSAHFDYFNWICSERSSEWWFTVQRQTATNDGDSTETHNAHPSGTEDAEAAEFSCDELGAISTRSVCDVRMRPFYPGCTHLYKQDCTSEPKRASRRRSVGKKRTVRRSGCCRMRRRCE